MGDNILAEHLGRFVMLTDGERAALGAIATIDRQYRRGSVIRAEHGQPGEIMVVRAGWIFCSSLLEDGRRQIIRLNFRGDVLGLDGLAFTHAPDTTTALTDTDVCVIDRAGLGGVFAAHPRLGAILFAAQQADRVTLTDRLISLGRNSARSRVAALVVWIAARLRAAGQDTSQGFSLPMTQEEIGDMTGLTAVHVNRTMRVLVEQGMIQRSGTTLRILEPERLARAANHVDRPPRLDLGWLPSARG